MENIKDTNRLNYVTEKAFMGFFEIVAKEYPEIKTGDFSPDETNRVYNFMKNTIENWININL